MKYLSFILLLTINFSSAYSQDTTVVALNAGQQKHIKTSETQRAFSFIMLAIGVTTSAIIYPNTKSLEHAVNAIAASMASGITAIVLYAASIRNRKKAKSFRASLAFEMPRNPRTGSKENSIGSVTLKIFFVRQRTQAED